jgi:hypothetical protein
VSLVELARYGNSFEAGAAQSALADAEIESYLFDMEMAAFAFGALISIRLMVLDEDFEAARKVLLKI